MPTLGFGTTLTWGAVEVVGLTNINGIEITVGEVNSTTHQSPDGYTETLPGLLTAGEVSLEGYFVSTDTTGQIAMMTDCNASRTKEGIITFPAETRATWTFSGFIKRIKIGDAPIEGLIPFSASIKLTGKPVFAVALI